MRLRMGEYVIESLLGQGATAQVHLAQHESTQQKVALKVFHPGLWDSGDNRRRAWMEFKTISSLKHPNIVGVVEALFDQDPPAVAMELVEGSSLESFQARLPYILPEVSVTVVIEVLKALEQAHSQGIIHRDLKPANILVSNDGRVLVTDFGHSKITDASRITLTGTILGSPDYMSPEQAQGESSTARSDVFSVGSILYFLLTGTKPFARSTPLATLAAVIQAAPEPAVKRNPKISAELNSLLEKALKKNLDERFASAAEFRAALENYLEALGLVPEVFSFALWMRDPSGAGLSALRGIADALSARAEANLKSGDWEQTLAQLSHLSLVAPESTLLVRLLGKIEEARARQKRQRRMKRAFILLSTAGVPLLCFLIWHFGKTPTASIPPAAPAMAAAAPLPRTEAIAIAPAPTPQPPARPTASWSQTVTFDLPDGVVAYWNNRRVNTARGVQVTKPGAYKLRLEKDGLAPIEQSILVKKDEPTHIRAR